MIKLFIDGFMVGEIVGFSFNEKQWENKEIDLNEIKGEIKEIIPSKNYDFYLKKSRNHEFGIEEDFPIEKNGKIIRKFLGVSFLNENGPIQTYSKNSDLKNLEWTAKKIEYEKR